MGRKAPGAEGGVAVGEGALLAGDPLVGVEGVAGGV